MQLPENTKRNSTFRGTSRSRLAQTVQDYSTAIADSSPVVSVLLCLKRGRNTLFQARAEAGKMAGGSRKDAGGPALLARVLTACVPLLPFLLPPALETQRRLGTSQQQ